MRCETMVRVARFELASLSAADFKSAVYANSTIPAKLILQVAGFELACQSATVIKTAMYSVSSYPQKLSVLF